MALGIDAGRDLLLGLLALREGMIDQAQLVAAFDVWISLGHRPIGEILLDQGALGLGQWANLERLAGQQFKDERGAGDLSMTAAYRGTSFVAGREPAETAPAAPGRGSGPVPRFQILRSHARGGLGEVFLALDPELKRQVALKALQAYHAHDPTSQARFILEAEVTGRLEHPGIVPVYGLGREPDGRPYYVMRFIEGETLKAAILRFHGEGERLAPRDRELAFRRLLQSVVAACNAVAYAHSRGVVHRDLKPENIMLGPFGETLVVDWGIAKTQADQQGAAEGRDPSPPASDSSLTRPGAAVGTPRYMSPEQASGDLDRVGPASDVYGLGATLYFLLAGQSPFPDGEVSDVLDRVQRGIFPAPRRLRRTADPALEGICLKAMALRPEERYASPLDLAREIEAWLADVRYRDDQMRALNEMKGSLARLCFERAQNLLGREKRAEGMLWLARALQNVPVNSPGLERVVRASLGSWHAHDRLLERSLTPGGHVGVVAFSPDGHRLATAGRDGGAQLWDVATGRRLASTAAHAGPVGCLEFSADGAVIATAGAQGTLHLWDAVSGRTIGKPMAHGAAVSYVRFSPDARVIATAGPGLAPALWQVETSEPILPPCRAEAGVLGIAFDPGGSLLAAACDDGRVLFWEVATGSPVSRAIAHAAAATSLAFDPAGQRILTGCVDGRARLWDLAGATIVREFPLPSAVATVAFNPAGTVITTVCADGTGRLWHPERGEPIGELLAHGAAIGCLAFNREGTILATGSRDRTVRLWDTATGLPLGPPLLHRGTVDSLSFSPDGRRLATGCSDGAARFWRVAPQIPGDTERISCWVRVTTDLDFDSGDAIQKLDPSIGWELRRRLHELGGPPPKKIERW